MRHVPSLLAAIWRHPANRDSRLRAIARAMTWQVVKRLTGRPVEIAIQGLRLRVHPDSHSASRALYFAGLPDYWEMRFLLDYLRPGDRFVDLGANVGIYSILAASVVGTSGRVDAFEPAGVPRAHFRESMDLNGLTNVTLHPVAVGEVKGTGCMDQSADDCCAHITSAGASN